MFTPQVLNARAQKKRAEARLILVRDVKLTPVRRSGGVAR